MGNSRDRVAALSAAARASAAIAADDRTARDAAIVEMDRDEYTLPEIATAAGMSVSHVQRIVVAAAAARSTVHAPAAGTD